MVEKSSDIEAIYNAAREKTSEAERSAYLDAVCGDDSALRARVEELLKAQDEIGDFLEFPAISSSVAVDRSAHMEGPGTIIGHYRLLELAGEGGMGLVYLAEQKEPVRRRVAFKIIKPGMDSKQVIARFEAERQALAVLDHPNIAKVFDAGTTEAGRPYFVMEYVRGKSITRYCDENKLTIEQRLRLFEQVCEAVQHAHQKGIIHRDLKPSNILVSIHGDRTVPKIIDFGIAKAVTQPLTDKTFVTFQGHLLGTLDYMSPEQVDLSTQDIDTRSDIYSLGVVLYELLTGVLPFESEIFERAGLAEIQQTIREVEPTSPSTRLTGLGENAKAIAARRGTQVIPLTRRLHRELEWIPLKAMRKDRCRRYKSASDMADDVRNYLNGNPLLAGPETTIYRVQKFVRKHAGSVMTVALVAAVIVLGLVVSIWQATVATKAKNEVLRAETEKDRQAQIAIEERDKAVVAQRQAEEQRRLAEASEEQAQKLLYAANMNLAQQAWEQNEMGRLRQLLEETVSYSNRSFEWYYWQRQAHLEIKTLRGNDNAPLAYAAFSSDGRLIMARGPDFTGNTDGAVKIWDADSGEELSTLPDHNILCEAFSPDSQLVCTGHWDGTAKVWEATSGRELRALKGHGAAILAVAFSPDGQRIATSGDDATAKVWDVANGKELLTLKGHSYTIQAVAFSPDGQRIVTGSYDDDGTAKVWDAASGKEVLALKGHGGPIFALAFSPDGEQIVTGAWDGLVQIWEARTGKELLTLKAHGILVSSVAFSPDGQRIVTGGGDKTAKVWDTGSGKELFRLRHSSRVMSVAFSPDGRRIVTGTIGGRTKIWDAIRDKGVLSLDGHEGIVCCIAYSPQGGQIATASVDQTTKIWDTGSGKKLFSLEGHSDGVRSVAFSGDGQQLCTGSTDCTAKVWEVASGRELITLKGHLDAVTSVAFSPDGQWIVTGSEDGTAKTWELTSGKNLLTLEGREFAIRSVAFSPDGKHIATASGTAKVWEAVTGKELLTLSGHNRPVRCVDFSPDGQEILTGSMDGAVKIWDAAIGKDLLTLKGHGGAILAAAFSPDGSRIITGSNDMTAKVWDAASGKEVLTLRGHNNMIRSVAFSPNGQQVATGDWDGTVKVWQAASLRQVNAWQQQERAETERLAKMRLEQTTAAEREKAVRAQDPGAIKQWLVLAPLAIDGQDKVAALAALDQQQLPQEATLHPRAGEQVKVGEIERTWEVVQQEDNRLDFNRFVGQPADYSLAYAVCYIDSQTKQGNLLMEINSGDVLKIYLNGQEIHRREWWPQTYPWQTAGVTAAGLKVGRNVLILKVVNQVNDWRASIWLTNAAGQPVDGIRVTLEPPEGGQP